MRLGFVPDDELQVHLRASDVVALPYREIFTSGSVLLAMSFGRAVIAPRRGCIAEAVESTARSSTTSTIHQVWPSALEQAKTADLDAMGAQARARAEAYDWAPIADQTLAVYRSVTR